jgi:hypothetical protein
MKFPEFIRAMSDIVLYVLKQKGHASRRCWITRADGHVSCQAKGGAIVWGKSDDELKYPQCALRSGFCAKRLSVCDGV